VTTIRHPYDVFVSLYFYIQRLPHLFQPGTHFFSLIGKAIDDPETIDYLKRGEDGFGMQIALALDWVQSGRSIVVRYEEMMADTPHALRGITDRIRPVSDEKIRRAVKANQASTLRRKSRTLNSHIRSGTSGDWRNHLTAVHLDAINSAHGPQIERLGYRVHDDPTG
jgi:hypothetical protein